jgi:O-antigen ligase
VFGVLRLGIVYYFYVLQSSGNGNGIWFVAEGSGAGAAVHHVGVLNAVLQTVLPFAFALLLHKQRSRLAIPIVLVIVFAVFLLLGTGGRASVLGLLVTSPVLLLAFRGQSLFKWVGVLVGLIVLLAILASTPGGQLMVERFTMWEDLDSTFEEQAMRWDSWQSALRMMRDYPLTGIGPGMWERYIVQYSRRIFLWGQTIVYTNSAHQLFLHYGAMGGVGVLLTLLVLLGIPIVRGLRSLWRETDKTVVILGCGVLWALLAFVFAGALGSGGFFEFVPGPSIQVCTTLDLGMLAWMNIGLAVQLVGKQNWRDK